MKKGCRDNPKTLSREKESYRRYVSTLRSRYGMTKSEATYMAQEVHKEVMLLKKKKQGERNHPATRIYGKVLRIEAQKTGKHNCDAACKKAGHRYFHDFKVKPQMFGLDDGSLLIKK